MVSQRYFWNSVAMVIPATIISTALGAINGYVLSKWKLPGSEIIFGCMLLGVFMPGQIALLPWAFLARQARPRQLGLWPRPRALHPGPELHHAVLPQLLRRRFPTTC